MTVSPLDNCLTVCFTLYIISDFFLCLWDTKESENMKTSGSNIWHLCY